MKRLLIFTLLLAFGCASRKKEVHSSENKTKFSAQVDTSISFRNKFDYAAALSSQVATQYQNIAIGYEGCDPGDSITIEQHGADGRLLGKTTIKGKGKANLSSGTGSRQEQVQADVKSSGTESGAASGSKKASGENTERIHSKQVETYAFPWWLWLIAVALVIGWLLNKRYGWLKTLKSHVTAMFFSK